MRELTAPKVDCAQDEIEITDPTSTGHPVRYGSYEKTSRQFGQAADTSSYTAQCPSGKSWRCIVVGRPLGQKPETVCEPLFEPEPVAVEAPTQWTSVEVDLCPASVEFPGLPTFAKFPAEVTPLENRVISTSSNGASFDFACTRLPPHDTPVEELLDGAEAGMLASTGGTLVSSKTLRGATGRSVVVQVHGGRLLARIFVEDDWLYTANVGPVHRIPRANLERFFRGVHFETSGEQ